jgi:transposase-like protein
MNDTDLNLITLSELFNHEEQARAFLEAKRWPDGPICPFCESRAIYKLTPKPESRKPVRAGVYKCKACRKQFTVRIGTIFEDSHIPLSKWLAAIHLMTSSKKGVSSHQLSRELGITLKSAWFLSHRVREAMREHPMVDLLRGVVEVDETYVGGKPRARQAKPRRTGRGTDKQAVMVLVQRNGSAHSMPIPRVDGPTLKQAIRDHVDRSATIMTDELHSYWGIGQEYTGGHFTVMHTHGEFARRLLRSTGADVISTNTAESYAALLKRGHYGIFHHLSKKHLHRYCDEFSFRWNHRKVTDGERMVAAIEGAKGKRLRYRRDLSNQ